MTKELAQNDCSPAERNWQTFFDHDIFDSDDDDDSNSYDDDDDENPGADGEGDDYLANLFQGSRYSEIASAAPPGIANDWDSDMASLFTLDDETIYTHLTKRSDAGVLIENLPTPPSSSSSRRLPPVTLPETLLATLAQRVKAQGLKEDDVLGIVEKLIQESERTQGNQELQQHKEEPEAKEEGKEVAESEPENVSATEVVSHEERVPEVEQPPKKEAAPEAVPQIEEDSIVSIESKSKSSDPNSKLPFEAHCDSFWVTDQVTDEGEETGVERAAPNLEPQKAPKRCQDDRDSNPTSVTQDTPATSSRRAIESPPPGPPAVSHNMPSKAVFVPKPKRRLWKRLYKFLKKSLTNNNNKKEKNTPGNDPVRPRRASLDLTTGESYSSEETLDLSCGSTAGNHLDTHPRLPVVSE